MTPPPTLAPVWSQLPGQVWNLSNRADAPLMSNALGDPCVVRVTFEILKPRLFRDLVQFCAALVDLVVGVGHHLGSARLRWAVCCSAVCSAM